MKSFLSALRNFAQGVGGLVVVILVALWNLSFLQTIVNGGSLTFGLAEIGDYLSTLAVAFALFWAQYKGKVLLSHLLMFLLFADALRTILVPLFSAAFGSITLTMIIGLLIMLYALGVVVAEFVEGKQQAAKLQYRDLLSIILFAAAVYLSVGWSAALLGLIPVLIALLLGSKVVGLVYAAATLVTYAFVYVDTLMAAFVFTTLLLLLVCVAALVFLVLDLVKALQKNEA